MEKEPDGTCILDIGSSLSKTGFANDDVPRQVASTVIGRPQTPVIMVGYDQREYHIGYEAQLRRGVLKLSHPVQRGLTQDWEDLEKIWHNTFYNELQIAPEEYRVLLTQASMTPLEHKEKMVQIMFEVFGVHSM